MAELVPATPRSGNLRGLCPDCERFIYRRVSLAALDLDQAAANQTAAYTSPDGDEEDL